MKIIATRGVAAPIPAPYDRWYDVIDMQTVLEDSGLTEDEIATADSLEGYNLKHVQWLKAKPEYEERLSLSALDELEQAEDEDGSMIVGMIIGDRFISIDEDEILANIGEGDGDWEELDSKSVHDMDGFITDYTLWKYLGDPNDVPDREIYVCMFGDKEIYGPNHDYCDYATDNEEDAREWFDNYSDDEEDILDSTEIDASVDTGLSYWYLTKHGLGPGMMPKDVKLLDCVEDGWDTYVLLDKMLTTEELNMYDMKEKAPSEELLANR